MPDRGPWARERWDRVIDLGQGGSEAYTRWAERFECPVVPLNSMRMGLAEFERIRAFMQCGAGRLCDQEGVDWWEMIAIMLHDKIDLVGVLRRFANSLEPTAQIHVTRGGFCATALSLMRDISVNEYPRSNSGLLRSVAHYWNIARKFPLPQLFEIASDKYDPVYSVRRIFARKRGGSGRPVVVLPSAYVNVSRLELAYATMLPETDFLLVTTRRSGRMSCHPTNVATVGIAAYVSHRKTTEDEYGELLERWDRLWPELEVDPDIALLMRMGFFESFPTRLHQGLIVRDAWRALFESEKVSGVLCGDDSNPITHIPVLLARHRNIPAIVSHHGALDGRHLIKQNHADVILAKGKMEEDYLLRVCGVAQKNVEIGAPAVPQVARHVPKSRASIVYFSESYEVLSGRTVEFYRDVLPRLANLSLRLGRRLVIKLHPAESRKERVGLVKRTLSPAQLGVTTVIEGPLTQGLLDETWFGVTVLSSAAVDCAERAIPCFFCRWLEYWPYGYIDQFERFGVGRALKSPEEIVEIPRLLQTYSSYPEGHRSLWEPIASERLRILLGQER